MSETPKNSKRELWILLSFILIIGLVLFFTEKKVQLPDIEKDKQEEIRTEKLDKTVLKVNIPELGKDVIAENVDLRIREKEKKVVSTPTPPVDFSVVCSRLYGNEVWYGTNESGIIIFDLNTNMWRHIPVEPEVDIRDIVSFEKFRSSLMIICRTKVFSYNGYEISEVIPENISFNYINASAVYKGTFMFLATDRGLFSYDGKLWEDYTNFFTSPNVRSVVSDSIQVYALGDYMVYRFVPEQKKFVVEVNQTDLQGAISSNNVIRYFGINKGIVYIGTSRSGLYSYSQSDKIIRSLYSAQADSQFVSTVSYASDGRIFVGSDNGIIGYSPDFNRELKLDYTTGLLNADVRSIETVEKDGNNALIIGTNNGVFFYNGVSVIPVYSGTPQKEDSALNVKLNEEEIRTYEKFSENTALHTVSVSTINELLVLAQADGAVNVINFSDNSNSAIKFPLSTIFSVIAGETSIMADGPEGFFIYNWSDKIPKKIKKPSFIGSEGTLGSKLVFIDSVFVLSHYEKGWHKYDQNKDSWSEISSLSNLELIGKIVNYKGKTYVAHEKKVSLITLEGAETIVDFGAEGLRTDISEMACNSEQIGVSDDSGMFLIYNTKTKKTIDHSSKIKITGGLPTNITGMIMLENNDTFIGTLAGVYKISSSGAKLFTTNDGLIVNQVTILMRGMQKGREIVLCGNEFGIKRFNGVLFDDLMSNN